MIVVAVLGVLLVAVVVVAFIRLRSLDQRAAALEPERTRLAADGEALRGQLDERRHELDELAPFRALADHAPEWIWIVNEHGTLTFSNAAGASLLGHDDLTGRSLAELTYEEGNLPASGDATELAEADLVALKWADRAGWWVD